MTAADVDAVVWLEGVALGTGQSHDTWTKRLAKPTSLARVAVDASGRIVGFIACVLVLDELGINHLAVLPEVRRRGVGSRLLTQTILEARESGAQEICLEVRKRNRAARQMYRRFGFKEAGVRSRYYQAPADDALILCLGVSPA